MSEDRWIKVEINMYDDIKLKLLDNMENRDLNNYVWTRSLVLAGKINHGGYLYITDKMPYTIKTLAIEFNRSIDEIKSAFNVLKKLEMIEFTEEKVFKIKNWEKHQNVEGMERYRQLSNERVAKHRAKKKEIKENNEDKANNHIQEIAEDNNEKIDNVDNHVEENTSDFAEKAPKEDSNNGNIKENNNHMKINDKCNVTCNDNNSDCNVTVTEQIKKENKIKKEKKIKKESESESEIKDKEKHSNVKAIHEAEGNLNAKEIGEAKTHSDDFSFDDSKKSSKIKKVNGFEQIGDSEKENMNNRDVAKLLTYYENITGILGGLNFNSLKIAINMHGYRNVKMAINKALEVNKANMTYINGILKNWRREGYPKDDLEMRKNELGKVGKSSSSYKNEFAGFKPKEPRKLTEAERRETEKMLI